MLACFPVSCVVAFVLDFQHSQLCQLHFSSSVQHAPLLFYLLAIGERKSHSRFYSFSPIIFILS